MKGESMAVKKKIIRAPALLTAAILSMTIPSPAVYGAAEHAGAAEETEVVFNRLMGDQKVDTELVGKIKVNLISVAMPSDGFDFQVYPEREFDAVNCPDGQIVGPDRLEVTNHSVVPVRLEISRVEDIRADDVVFAEKFPGGPEQSFRLLDSLSGVGPPGTALLVLGISDKHYTSREEFEQYAICPGKPNIPVADLEAEETVSLKLYGKVAPDFYGAYRFTVRPTLKISALKAE